MVKSRYVASVLPSGEIVHILSEEQSLKRKKRSKRKKIADKAYYETHREERKLANSKGQVVRNRRYKIDAIKKICDVHQHLLGCGRCGEHRLWVLAIVRINGDGKNDREKNGYNSTKFYRRILDDEIDCNTLEVECFNCCYAKTYHGKYPDEIGDDCE